MYLHHITLTTGHVRRSQRAEIADATISAVSGWLDTAINTGRPHALVAPVQDYAAQALVAQGALVVTVYGRVPQAGARLPLVSFGIARRSRQAQPLWDALIKGAPQAMPGLTRPPVPWCAVTVQPTAASDADALLWLAQFEAAVAWAWVTRSPELRVVA